MIFGLSIGCIHKFTIGNRDNFITKIREELGDSINALEIMIPTQELFSFYLSEKNRKWMAEKLKYVSFHMPFLKEENHVVYCENIIHMFNGMIKNIVYHVNDTEHPVYKYMLNSFPDKIIIENTEEHFVDTFYYKRSCLDISHYLKLYNWNYSFLKTVLDKEVAAIKQIHLSNCVLGECHIPFYRNPNEVVILKTLNLKRFPILLEVNAESWDELKEEIKFIKENI